MTTACLVGLALAYFWPLLRLTEPLSLGGDFAAQTYPYRRYVTAALFQGRLPHWAPEIAFGFPLLADIETHVFYPISLLFSLLNGPDISFRALELQLVLHHVVGGLGMSLLLRPPAPGGVPVVRRPVWRGRLRLLELSLGPRGPSHGRPVGELGSVDAPGRGHAGGSCPSTAGWPSW